MINHQIAYLRPKNITDAVTILQDKGSETKALAGGTDLLVQMDKGLTQAKCLVSLRDLPLNFIKEENNGVRIGSTTTLSHLANSELLREGYTALWEAARKIGSAQIRNWGTIGGNLCNAAPSADTAPPLLVMGANIDVTSTDGTRSIPIDKFFVGPGQTVVGPNELVTSIFIPCLSTGTSTAYVKFGRTEEDIALVGIAVLLRINKEGTIHDLKLAIGAAAPTPIRAYKAEEMARGSRVNDLAVEEICEKAVSITRPIDDVRSSASYRRTLVRVLTKRGISLAVERNLLVWQGGGANER